MDSKRGVVLVQKSASVKDLKSPDPNVRKRAVVTKNDIGDLMGMLKNFITAQTFRTVKATKLNPASSRGHCIMFVEIWYETLEGQKVNCTLNFADLAGSEKVSKS